MKKKIYKFNHLGNAYGWMDHSVRPMRIIIGDDQKFWVCTPAVAERLLRAGYEMV